ncbi:hypothetical protein [Gandjariella thermophila]|uniref:Uncharacterized protein n=1 Tax=Gandjariella thermophila TaxID=1931992 RepID=A0A4D4JGG0_9PSEU|nr:hypothetical protein [Gandjariella thermophila]GDY32973.1 hypothetical protein GTS_46060 [Gandjariella thermophila]
MTSTLWVQDSAARRLIRADQIVEIGTVEVHLATAPSREARWRLEVETRNTYGGVDVASERGDWEIEPRQFTLAYGHSDDFRQHAHVRLAETIATYLTSGGVVRVSDETASHPARFAFAPFAGE